MKQTLKYVLTGAAALIATSSFATISQAADYIDPPVIELPPQPVATGGWYLRGDVGYSKAKFRGAKFPTYIIDTTCGATCVTAGDEGDVSGSLKGSFIFGGGLGYQVTDYFRTDLTLDYMTRSSFDGGRGTWCGGVQCSSSDSAKMSALSLMANAYVDLANINGITPYVGAGIGGTYVKWGNVVQQNPGAGQNPIDLGGASSWRFTWALMAGASYDLTNNLKLDAGYRFRRVNGGKMSDGAYSNGPTYDKGFNIHDVRVGLRYQFDN